MSYYIKLDSTRYILEVEIYDLLDSDNISYIPHFYKILNIYDMTNNVSNNEEINELYLDEYNDFICHIENNDDNTFTKHCKKIEKNMFCIYQNICYHDDKNKIYKDILLSESKSISFFIFNNLSRAYKIKEMAFFENFIENNEWKYFTNGYSGLCKKFDLDYFGKISLEKEFYLINNIRNGIYKKYDKLNRIIVQQNYINGKKIGNGLYYNYSYDDNQISIEKRIYYNDNYYYSEISIQNEILYCGYYYYGINISYIAKFFL
jgi:hypothetical protein